MNAASSNRIHRQLHGGGVNNDKMMGRTLLDLLRSRDRLLLGRSTKGKRQRDDDNDDDGGGGGGGEGGPDREYDDDDDDGEDGEEVDRLEIELISRLRHLNSSMRRRGLFDGDVARAASYRRLAAERSSAQPRPPPSLSAASSSAADATATTTVVVDDEDAGGGAKRRKRKKGGGGGGGGGGAGAGGSPSASSYGIHLDSFDSGGDASRGSSSSSGDRIDTDEGSVITAICKILGVFVGRRRAATTTTTTTTEEEENDDDAADQRTVGRRCSPLLTCAALDVLSSLCDHARDGAVTLATNNGGGDPTTSSSPSSSCCASVEGDMVGSVGPYLLDALADGVVAAVVVRRRIRGDGDPAAAASSRALLAEGRLRSCASVVSLLGTRLSRSTKTLRAVRDAAWGALLLADGGGADARVRRAATALLASLPLTGNADGGTAASTSRSEAWSRSVADGTAMLRWAIGDFFPAALGPDCGRNGGGGGGGAQSRTEIAAAGGRQTPRGRHAAWRAFAGDAPSFSARCDDDDDREEVDLGDGDPTDRHRSRALLCRVRCLAMYLRSLLVMENYPLHFAPNDLVLPLDPLLDVSEMLLAFPLAAEASHRTTKARLRSTPVDGGMISPNAALAISTDVRTCGHDLLDVVLESCRGGSGALGRARRIVGIAASNLRTSCSASLVRAVDGGARGRGGGIGNGGEGNGGGSSGAGGSRLRESVPLRTRSVRTFHVAAVSLGSGIMSSTGTSRSVSRALVLLGGCLLEQVRGDGTNAIDDEWGTLGEKAALV